MNLKTKNKIFDIYFIIQYFEANSWYKAVAFVFVWLERIGNAATYSVLCIQSHRSTIRIDSPRIVALSFKPRSRQVARDIK